MLKSQVAIIYFKSNHILTQLTLTIMYLFNGTVVALVIVFN